MRKFLAGLPADVAAPIYETIDAIERLGIDGANVDARQIKGKLWELRFIGVGQRVFYVVISGPTMILLHAYRKQGQKAPKSEVDLALKRMHDVLGQ